MSGQVCGECGGLGFIITVEDGRQFAEPCRCREKHLAMARLKRSGIADWMLEKGFNNFYDLGDPVLMDAKNQAIAYYQGFLKNENSRNNSIIFCGQSGSGKTHLAMAICTNLLTVCCVGVSYMAYRNTVTEIKQLVNDKEGYYAAMWKYCTERVLCIDDMLKGRSTEADLNILYELINYRYMHNKPMIISTEKTQEELIGFDEATGSRILEMCRGNIITLSGKGLNYRLYADREEVAGYGKGKGGTADGRRI